MADKFKKELSRSIKAMSALEPGSKEYNACLRNVQTLQQLSKDEKLMEAQEERNDYIREQDTRAQSLKEKELDLRERELSIRVNNDIRNSKSDKIKNIVTIASFVVPAVVNVACLITYKRMGTIALAAEYADDKILPRSYSDASKNVQQMIKRG